MVDAESERWALGAAMSGPEALAEMVNIVQAEHFTEHYRPVWEAITTIQERGDHVATVTVAYALSAIGDLDRIGGINHLKELVQDCPMTFGARAYAQAIREAAQRRQIHNAGASIETWARECEPAEALAKGMEMLMGLAASVSSERMTLTAGEVLKSGLADDIEAFLVAPAAMRGIASGLPRLDAMLGGIQRGAVYLFGAETSLGKSLFVQDRVRHWSLKGLRCLVFTTEMSAHQVGWRSVFQLAGVDPYQLRRAGNVTPETREAVRDAYLRFNELPLHFCDRGDLSVAHLVNEVRKAKTRWGGLDVVAIDHIDMVKGQRGNGSKTQELEDTTASVKAMARDEDVPVIEVSHLSRVNQGSAQNRNSRFRNSESKPQDADVAMFLAPVNADGGEMTTDEARARMSNPGLLQVRLEITKNRWGPTGSVPLWLSWQQGGRFVEYV